MQEIGFNPLHKKSHAVEEDVCNLEKGNCHL